MVIVFVTVLVMVIVFATPRNTVRKSVFLTTALLSGEELPRLTPISVLHLIAHLLLLRFMFKSNQYITELESRPKSSRPRRDIDVARPRRDRDETETRPRRDRDETETRPRRDRDETETRPRRDRDETETRPRRDRDETETRPRRDRDFKQKLETRPKLERSEIETRHETFETKLTFAIFCKYFLH